MRSIILATLLLGLVFPISLSAGAADSGQLQVKTITTEKFFEFVGVANEKNGAILIACCKTCRKGKACGDSCINRSYTCRKGQGCACDG